MWRHCQAMQEQAVTERRPREGKSKVSTGAAPRAKAGQKQGKQAGQASSTQGTSGMGRAQAPGNAENAGKKNRGGQPRSNNDKRRMVPRLGHQARTVCRDSNALSEFAEIFEMFSVPPSDGGLRRTRLTPPLSAGPVAGKFRPDGSAPVPPRWRCRRSAGSGHGRPH